MYGRPGGQAGNGACTWCSASAQGCASQMCLVPSHQSSQAPRPIPRQSAGIPLPRRTHRPILPSPPAPPTAPPAGLPPSTATKTCSLPARPACNARAAPSTSHTWQLPRAPGITHSDTHPTCMNATVSEEGTSRATRPQYLRGPHEVADREGGRQKVSGGAAHRAAAAPPPCARLFEACPTTDPLYLHHRGGQHAAQLVPQHVERHKGVGQSLGGAMPRSGSSSSRLRHSCSSSRRWLPTKS